MKTLDYLKKYKRPATLAFFAKVFEAVLELLVLLVVAHMIDEGMNQQNAAVIRQDSFYLVFLPIIGFLSAMICQYLASVVGQSVGTDLREASFKKLNHLDLEQIEALGASSIMTRICSDTIIIQDSVAMILRLVSRIPVLLIGSVLMAFVVSPRLAPIFIIGGLLLGVLLVTITYFSNQGFQVIQKKMDGMSKAFRENLSGNRVVRAFANQSLEKEKFEEQNGDLRHDQVRVGRLQAIAQPASTLLVNLAIAFILYYGGRLVGLNALMQGDVIALVNYMNSILLALNVLVQVLSLFARGKASLARLDELLTMEGEIETSQACLSEEKNELQQEGLSIDFEDVSFAYESKDVVSDLTFSIAAGEFVGIIGPTASGKSTLMKLVLRFYDAGSGQILVNGRSIQDYVIQDLRDQIAWVPQDSVLFEGSIRDNLLMGQAAASDEDLIVALEVAQIKDELAASQKSLDTMVQQGGRNFSGGQRQRLTIARALVQGKPLIILDDAVSALDFQTESKLLHALKQQPATLILISQRVSSLLDADQILVMDQGHLVGRGKHEDLLAHNPAYQAIYESQTKEEK